MLLSYLGRREDALTAATEAVAIFRLLTDARLDSVVPDLAMSQNNLGMMLSDLAHQLAVIASLENCEAAQVELASSLNNLLMMLSDLGRQWAVTAREYVENCEAAQVEPDQALLERIIKVVELLDAG